MRLAVLADIHGNLLALDAVLADLAAQGGADKLWVLGDLAASGPRPSECIQRLRGLKEASFISGNTDRYVVTGERPRAKAENAEAWPIYQDRMRRREAGYNWTLAQLGYAEYEFLAGLRSELELEVADYGWIIGFHAAPGSDERVITDQTPTEEVLDSLLDREGRLACYGHIHTAVDRDLGAWRLVNPSSVGFANDDWRASYALITFDKASATVDQRRVTYDRDAVEADLRARHPNGDLAPSLWGNG